VTADRVLCVLCRVGADRLAIPARDVHKVVEKPRITRMPRLPAAVVGIAHHRGRIVTVIDALALLQLQEVPARSADPRLLVLDRSNRQLGLLVDGVDEVDTLRMGADLAAGPSKALRVAQHQGLAVLAVDPDLLVELILA
jgi:purine-binding chemotaxis protein CheW